LDAVEDPEHRVRQPEIARILGRPSHPVRDALAGAAECRDAFGARREARSAPRAPAPARRCGTCRRRSCGRRSARRRPLAERAACPGSPGTCSTVSAMTTSPGGRRRQCASGRCRARQNSSRRRACGRAVFASCIPSTSERDGRSRGRRCAAGPPRCRARRTDGGGLRAPRRRGSRRSPRCPCPRRGRRRARSRPWRGTAGSGRGASRRAPRVGAAATVQARSVRLSVRVGLPEQQPKPPGLDGPQLHVVVAQREPVVERAARLRKAAMSR
jgi:hypothetical protein